MLQFSKNKQLFYVPVILILKVQLYIIMKILLKLYNAVSVFSFE